MSAPGRVCWVDGRLLPLATPALRADDRAFAEGLGCFTTARVAGGSVRLLDRHVRRLCRDAAALEIGRPDPAHCAKALAELAAAAFGAGDGVVRLQASRDADGALHLVGVTRPLPPARATWTAITPAFPHPGPGPHGGAKVSSRLVYALASGAARAAGADEAVLRDAAGRLVEGAITNLFGLAGDGALVTTPLARGVVEGVARAVVLERVPEAVERDFERDEPLRELIATNAVRGALPVVALDGRPIGDGRPGAFASRLAAVLAED